MNFVKFSFFGVPYLHKGKRKNQNNTNYHHYSTPASLGEPRAADGGMNDANKFEVGHTWVQRASTWSSIRSALHTDPSSSSSVPNSRKCDKAVANTDWVP
jgi:hypothetical protein